MLNLKISQKLPLILVMSAFIAGGIIGFMTYTESKNALIKETERSFSGILDARVEQFSAYFNSIREDLHSLSDNIMTRRAVREYSAAWKELGSSAEDILQKLYINDNPHPTGKKENLDYANDDSTYSQVHKTYHPTFRKFLRQKDYYDIFLFDLDGNLIYTVFKELDYATNLNTGKWKNTDLGNAFRAAKNSKKKDSHTFFDFKPYAPSHGAPASFISSPVLDEIGNTIGVLVFQMPIDRINTVMNNPMNMGESGETYIVGADFLMRSDSRFSKESTILKRKVSTEQVKKAIAGESGNFFSVDYRNVPVLAVYKPYEYLGTRWAMLAEIDVEEMMRPIITMRNDILLTVGAILIVVTLIGFFVTRSVATPISAIVVAMEKLRSGDKNFEVPYLDRHDEIGEMADALQAFKETAIKADELAKVQEGEEERLKEERRRTNEALVEAFNSRTAGVLENVSAASTELYATAGGMVESAGMVNEKSAGAADISEQTSQNVQTVASATEELSASIQEIASQVANASIATSEAVQQTETADKTVNMLAEAALEIGQIVSVISDIAEQINLLALNATIESARAGDAGKGFAVVASEVKNLAGQTTSATAEIAEKINKVQDASNQVVDALGEIKTTIEKTNEISAAIASAVEEQGAATQDIACNIQTSATGVQEVSKSMAEIKYASIEADNGAKEVLSAAENLSKDSEKLSESIQIFLTDIKAA